MLEQLFRFHWQFLFKKKKCKFPNNNSPCLLWENVFVASVDLILTWVYPITNGIFAENLDHVGRLHRLQLLLTYHHYLPPFCVCIFLMNLKWLWTFLLSCICVHAFQNQNKQTNKNPLNPKIRRRFTLFNQCNVIWIHNF